MSGDVGSWIEELLFGFRIDCSPPSPHELSRLIGIRTRADAQQLHNEITARGCARITATAFQAAAREPNPTLALLRLTQQDGHVKQLEGRIDLDQIGDAVEEPPPKRLKVVRARVALSDVSCYFQDLSAEKEEEEEDEEEEEESSDEDKLHWVVAKE